MSMGETQPRSLREIQEDFFRLVTQPLDANDRSPSIFPDGSSAEAAAERLLTRSAALTSLQRAELYNRQYWFRLIDGLVEDFPGLYRLLGAGAFCQMAVAYLGKYPSRSFTMRYLGAHLATFLRENPSWLGTEVAFGLELAAVEYAQAMAFEAEELPALNPAEIVSATLGELTLVLQPCISLFELTYPVDEWLRGERSYERDVSEASFSDGVSSSSAVCTDSCEGRVDSAPPKKPTWLAVHRSHLKIYFKALDKPQYEVLTALKRGETLAESLDHGIEALPEESRTPEKIAIIVKGWFTQWGELKWFAKG